MNGFSRETFMGADQQTSRGMLFDMISELHETVVEHTSYCRSVQAVTDHRIDAIESTIDKARGVLWTGAKVGGILGLVGSLTMLGIKIAELW